MFKDQRASGGRDHCEVAATIVVDPASPATPCLIKDISEQGAKLQVGNADALPDVFSVVLPVLDEIVDERSVRVRWRNADHVGVEFVLQDVEAAAPAPHR